MGSKVTFASIVLNEAEYIGKNLEQHYPFADEWIIVEGAVTTFPRDRVTRGGLSTDTTAEIIRNFPDPDKKIRFVQAGWQSNKEALRNEYTRRITADTDTVIVFDADEFLRRKDLGQILDQLQGWLSPGCLRIPHVHFWKTPQQIITGEYFNVPHNRCYRWRPGASYSRSHNHPEFAGVYLHEKTLVVQDRDLINLNKGSYHPQPVWFHYGFCKSAENIADKNTYYVNRGEAQTRPQTTRNRAAWFQEATPEGCQLHPWVGDYPEVFQT